MNNINISKQICFDILQCCILWYEGAEPTQYGYRGEVVRIGKNLSDNLFQRVENLITQFKQEGKLIGGKYNELEWGNTEQ